MRRLWAFLILLAPATVAAQTNTFGYTQQAVAYDYEAPPGTVSAMGLSDDDYQAFTLPWAFPYYAGSFTAVYVSDNGGVGFDAFDPINFSNGCLPANFGGAPDIAVYWDDLEPVSAFGWGDVYAWHDTSGGDDRVILSWEDIAQYGVGLAGGTFQIHLYPTGNIEFHWQDTTFGGGSGDNGSGATIGIQDAVGGTFDPLQHVCNTNTTLQNTGLQYSLCSDSDGDTFDDDACGGTDCDDGDATIYPGALEICGNGLDENCNGTDRAPDLDGDTYVSTLCVGGDDCNDSNAAINPSVDADGDGWNVCLDCNDSPGIGAFLFPGNTEVCGNGIDEDCSGADDPADGDGDGFTNDACGGDDCDDTDPAINPSVDLDQDGFDACADCNDLAPTANPAGIEVCDTLDNDCDGNADNVDADGDGDAPVPCGGGDCDDNDPAVGANTDADGDTFDACVDCDDDDAAVYPGAPEVCDSVDSDCDGLEDVFDLDIGASGSSTVTGTGAAATLAFGGSSTANVSASGVVQALTVTVDLDYYFLSDAQISLVSPSGTTVMLADAVGAPFSDLAMTGTTFDDNASADIGSGSDPFSGSFAPEGSLSDFIGESVTGAWTLQVTDLGSFFGVGNIYSWSVWATVLTPDDADGDLAVDSCGDCDPGDGTIYPGAEETCSDGIDQDCDSIDPTGDIDGDGYVDATCGGDDCDDFDAAVNPGVDGDGDGSDVCLDCDDNSPTTYPGAPEACGDTIDQNCNGLDEVADADGDGYVNEACLGGDDCDDTNAFMNPGTDQDGDGYSICDDCVDVEAQINPGLPEFCNDGWDNDCDGGTDNIDEDGDGFIAIGCFQGDDCDDTDPDVNPDLDADGDNWNACEECDDNNADVHPFALEICDDTLDQDCDGFDLAADADGDGYDNELCVGGDDCDDEDEGINPGATDLCDGVDLDCDAATTFTDADGDGFADAACGGDDCDDAAISIHPDANEQCDGIDNDCDGVLHPDGEMDGDGDGALSCDDCDDANPELFPAQPELCNGIDDNCNGEADDGVVRDGDGDGFEREACGGNDCDDRDESVNLDSREDCSDGIDNDCDGVVDAGEDCDRRGCTCSAASSGYAGPFAAISLLALVRRRRTSPSV